MHAEELPFSFTLGRGGREGGAEEEKKKKKKREGEGKLLEYNNQIKTGGEREMSKTV